jgi:hypothetical protein
MPFFSDDEGELECYDSRFGDYDNFDDFDWIESVTNAQAYVQPVQGDDYPSDVSSESDSDDDNDSNINRETTYFDEGIFVYDNKSIRDIEELRYLTENVNEDEADNLSNVIVKGIARLWKRKYKNNQQSRLAIGINEIRTLNNSMFTDTNLYPLPITNVGTDKDICPLTIHIIGPNGFVKANAMFDTGCVANGIIGPTIANKAGIKPTKHGCSYNFIVDFGNKIYIGSSVGWKGNSEKIPSTNSYLAKSYISAKSRSYQINEINGGSTINDYCGNYKGNGIDLLIGYDSVKEIAKMGYFPTIPQLLAQDNLVMIPYSFWTGLKITICDCSIDVLIDTGDFRPIDLTLPQALFKEFVKPGPSGEKAVPELSVKYNGYECKLENVIVQERNYYFGAPSSYKEFRDRPYCLASKNFIEKLLSKNFVPAIF